jgi:hypothetical protein
VNTRGPTRLVALGMTVGWFWLTGQGAFAHGTVRHPRLPLFQPHQVRYFRLSERVAEVWDGVETGRHTFSVSALVTETLDWHSAARERVTLRLSSIQAEDGAQRVLVAPFDIRATLTFGRLVGEQTVGFTTHNATWRTAEPTLARTLAYVLQGRRRWGGSRWAEAEAYVYRGVPINLPLVFSGRPAARVEGEALIPPRQAVMGGYTVEVDGAVREVGQLLLGAASGPPATYHAVTVVALTAHYAMFTVERDTVTVSVTLKAFAV